jgi:CheY-like chemotaxis protein
VAHDFNNLLSVITSYGTLLLADFPEDDRRCEDLRELLEAAKRASHLTRQLLAFSRRQLVQPTVLDLNSVVSNVERMLSRIIGEDIELTMALDPTLGRVRADPGQIEQILMNVSVNARDAMPSGGKLTIETANVELDGEYPRAHAGVTPGPFAVISVSDTGIGMDAETQARIFEPFFTTKEVGKGTGLGLSTVYGIVRQAGGHVWVYSEPGQGTTFKVYLPTVDEPLTLKQSRRPEVAAAPPSESILLVEDDTAVRHVAYRILQKNGYRVFEARDAAEARAICDDPQARIDLLLTDVVMPGANGPDLASELTRMRPGLRVLYMSGYAGAAVVRHGRLPPETAFLDKPFTPETLTRRVREVLNTGARAHTKP